MKKTILILLISIVYIGCAPKVYTGKIKMSTISYAKSHEILDYTIQKFLVNYKKENKSNRYSENISYSVLKKTIGINNIMVYRNKPNRVTLKRKHSYISKIVLSKSGVLSITDISSCPADNPDGKCSWHTGLLTKGLFDSPMDTYTNLIDNLESELEKNYQIEIDSYLSDADHDIRIREIKEKKRLKSQKIKKEIQEEIQYKKELEEKQKREKKRLKLQKIEKETQHKKELEFKKQMEAL